MPAPSSDTVTVKYGSPASGAPTAPDTAMWTRAAPARRLFWRVSVKMSASVAA